MGAGHSHPPPGQVDADVLVSVGARVALHGLLIVLAVATVTGLVLLWPSSFALDQARQDVEFAAEGVTFPAAEIVKAYPGCEQRQAFGEESACDRLDVRITEGADEGTETSVPVAAAIAESGLRAGDTVTLVRIPETEQAPASYSFFGVDRSLPLWTLLAAFVVVVAAVARWRGLLGLVGLAIAGVVLWRFTLPALLAGESGLLVGLVTGSVIMYVVLYLAHGPTVRTSAALAGTLLGIGLTALIGAWSLGFGRLSGLDEGAGLLTGLTSGLDYQGLLMCAVILAGLGVLNDVTITQASAVWELRAANADLSRRELFVSGMRIGRDHIASTIYTIVFAYAGSALSLLLVISLYNRPFAELLGTEEIATEVVRTLVTAIGLVLAVPLTTAIAALTVGAADRPPAGRRRAT